MYSYDTSDLLNGLSRGGSVLQGLEIWTMIASVLAIVGGAIVYFMFIKSKTDFKGGLKKLQDYLSGRIMHIESIAKVLYYAGLIYVVLTSINNLILINNGLDVGHGIVYFLLTLFFGPIIVRFLFEIVMVFIGIWRNTKDIAGKK